MSMITNKIDTIKQCETDKELEEAIYDIIKEERLIAYSLASMLREKYLKEKLPELDGYLTIEDEEVLKVYLSFNEMFKEHYLEYRDD